MAQELSLIHICFPEYCRVYLNDVPVGNGRQIRIRGYLYDKASRLIPFMVQASFTIIPFFNSHTHSFMPGSKTSVSNIQILYNRIFP